MIPALPSLLKICSRYWCGMLQREDISFICSRPEPYDSARANSAAMPYLVLLLIVNLESFLAKRGHFYNLNYSQSTVLIVMSGFMKVKFSMELQS
jgi:hypothetical protein